MAARYWVGGNATWDNTAGTKWALTSGGAGGQAVPTASDDVFLDNGAGTGNVTTATSASICTCKSLTCTGYVGTLTVNGTIIVAGDVTLVSAMTITTSTGTPILNVTTGTANLTSNTKTWPYALTIGGNFTHTLVDNWTIGGAVIAGNATGLTLNGNTLICNAGFSQSTAGFITGSTIIKMAGTGILACPSGAIKSSVTIDTSGTITIGSITYNTGTFTYVTGTTIISGTLTINASVTLNTSGITWAAFTISGSSTITLNSNLTISGNFTSSGVNVMNGNTFNIGGGANIASTSLSGTTAIVFNGTGTLAGVGTLNNTTTINTAGTLTINTFNYGTGTLTYITGTIAGTLALALITSCTVNTVGITWTSITISAGPITINSTLRATTFTPTMAAGSNTFNGTAGWDVDTFVCTAANRTYTLAATVTYRIRSSITNTGGTRATHNAFQSSSGTLQAILTLDYGATQDIDFVNATRIDSSLGQTIKSYAGTLTTATNWVNLVPYPTVGYTFVN